MENFSTVLKDRIVTLRTATDVVRFSFIVRKSISYLDLGLREHWKVFNQIESPCDCCAWKLSNSFINTEEKCRKLFTQSRRLLYTLHLDLPKDRERNLKDKLIKNYPNSITYSRDPYIPHIAVIIPICGFDVSIISDLVEEAIKITEEKLKILAWILKMSFNSLSLLCVLEIRTVNKFIDCFYPEIKDPIIFKDFIMNFDFAEWISKYEKPEILEYLLYYARRYGRRDLSGETFPIDKIIDLCILDDRHFLNIGPILKYINVPRFSEDDYHLYYADISTERPNMTEDALYNAENRTKRERVHLMLQFIWMYIACGHDPRIEDASEALRLIWSCVPDAFISYKEFKRAFGEVFSADELKKIFGFYVTAVGDFRQSTEPRSLQHLCRTVIRKTLRENQIWIPEGLGLMGLPKLFQSFLNLEF